MYLLGDQNSSIEPLVQRLHELTQELFSDFEQPGDLITIEAAEDLYTDRDNKSIFLVQEGFVQAKADGRVLMHHEEGDLVGVCHSFGLPSLQNSVDEHCELICIDRDDWLKHIYREPRRMHLWSQYLVTHVALLKLVLGRALKDSIQPSAGYLNFRPGDFIINEGDVADQVYTIITGHAEAYVDGVKVGEVLKDEIFGAMAVFTNTPRSASIIATTACTVMAVRKDEFVHLIKARPETCMTLIENMSRRIQSLNEQLLNNEKQNNS